MIKTRNTVYRLISAAIIALNWSITSIVEANELTTLTLPVAAYIVDADNKDSALSSQRTLKSLRSHFAEVNKIWAQANIQLDPVVMRRITAPPEALHGLSHGIGQGGLLNFFRSIRTGEIDIDRNANGPVIWIFYVRNIQGVNGLNPNGVNAIFVVDSPTNQDYRVTSHELGHILGLHHAQDDSNKLLFSGSNGSVLSEIEKTVARYSAENLIPN